MTHQELMGKIKNYSKSKKKDILNRLWDQHWRAEKEMRKEIRTLPEGDEKEFQKGLLDKQIRARLKREDEGPKNRTNRNLRDVFYGACCRLPG